MSLHPLKCLGAFETCEDLQEQPGVLCEGWEGKGKEETIIVIQEEWDRGGRLT